MRMGPAPRGRIRGDICSLQWVIAQIKWPGGFTVWWKHISIYVSLARWLFQLVTPGKNQSWIKNTAKKCKFYSNFPLLMEGAQAMKEESEAVNTTVEETKLFSQSGLYYKASLLISSGVCAVVSSSHSYTCLIRSKLELSCPSYVTPIINCI